MLQAAGVDRIITMDLHADQIQGFFDVPVDHLYGSTVLIPYIKSLGLRDFAIASPDIGGAKRANSWAKYFDSGLIICHKTRIRANEVADMKVIGDVEGKNIIVVDDMIDTAGTIAKRPICLSTMEQPAYVPWPLTPFFPVKHTKISRNQN